MEHGDYAYIDGRESFCNIKIIDKMEQIDLIKYAASISEVNLKRAEIHQENYNRYEVNGEIKYGLKTQWTNDKVDGYCQTYNLTHGKRYSITPHTSFNCAECLADALIFNRAFQPGIDVEVIIPKSSNTNNVNIDELNKVQFRLNKGICELTLDQYGTIKTTDFIFKIRVGQKPQLTIGTCKLKNVSYYGNCTITMLGLPVCKSILMGMPCKSIKAESKDFFVCSVPRGYPGWTELQREFNRDGKSRPPGKIWVHSKCKACTDMELIKPDLINEDNMVKNRDKIIISLMAENEKLREQSREYSIMIEKLRAELNKK
jgi:hypothetical protein